MKNKDYIIERLGIGKMKKIILSVVIICICAICVMTASAEEFKLDLDPDEISSIELWVGGGNGRPKEITESYLMRHFDYTTSKRDEIENITHMLNSLEMKESSRIYGSDGITYGICINYSAGGNKRIHYGYGRLSMSMDGAHYEIDGSIIDEIFDYAYGVKTSASEENMSGLKADTDDIKVLVDGVELEFDMPPVIENGRVLVPLKTLAEAFNKTVERYGWEQGQSVIISGNYGAYYLILTIGKLTMEKEIINTSTEPGAAWYSMTQTIDLDVPARIIEGRTFVPLRAVSEAFSADVQWDGETKTVTITSDSVQS